MRMFSDRNRRKSKAWLALTVFALFQAFMTGGTISNPGEEVFYAAKEGGVVTPIAGSAKKNDLLADVSSMRDSCVRGSAEACNRLGYAYLHGEKIQKDPIKARAFLERACDLGVGEACGLAVSLEMPEEEEEEKILGIFGGEQGVSPTLKEDQRITEGLSESSSKNLEKMGKGAKVPPPIRKGFPKHTEFAKKNRITLSGRITADFDGDRRTETVGWRVHSRDELGEYYQLLFIDENGWLLWQGPRVRSDADPLVPVSLDTGVAMPEMAADIDGDGAVELLIPEPQGDVAPQYYRRLKWNGQELTPLPSAVLMADSSRSGHFLWSRPGGNCGTWISHMRIDNTGEPVADVTRLSCRGESATGEAVIRFFPGGAALVRWIVPLDSPESVNLSSRYIHSPSPSQRSYALSTGRETIRGYRARIGTRDHYNSRGRRLWSIHEILRQDRANYHRLGRGDPEDEYDPWFHSFASRSRIESMRIVPVDVDFRTLREAVLYGTPLLQITPSGQTLSVRLLGY